MASEMNAVLNFHRVVQHVQHVDLARYHNVFNENDNQDMRIQYLLGNMNLDVLKVTIQQREKKREKERAIRRALEVLVQAGTDLIRRMMAETDVTKKRAIMEEVDALRLYVNELLTKVHDRLKLSVALYKSDWSSWYPFSPSTKKAEKLKEERARQAAATAAVTANVARTLNITQPPN
jgi:hypothetical protein